MCYLNIFQNRKWREKKAFKKCTLCILLKASILNSGIIFLCGVLIRLRHPLTWSIRYFLSDDKVIRMSAYWRCFAVRNGYAGASDHPRELLMHTGRKPGKSWSWVDTSLSLVPCRDEYVRYGMVRLDER